MATNFEFYKDAILGYVEEYASFPAFVNGKLVTCVSGDCQQCIFRSPNCFAKRVEWLYAEHIEPPKLTKRERAFCEAMQMGWIAYSTNHAVFSTNKPRICETEKREYLIFGHSGNAFVIPYDMFGWIKKNEFFSIEDLLKLDVMEDAQHETD